jgi:hypothetical protein
MTVIAEFISVERKIDAAADVVPERDRAQQRGPVATLALAHGERGGHDGTARVAQ